MKWPRPRAVNVAGKCTIRARKYCVVTVMSIGIVMGLSFVVTRDESFQMASSVRKTDTKFSEIIVSLSTSAFHTSTSLSSVTKQSITSEGRWFDPKELLKSTIVELERKGLRKPEANINVRVKKIKVETPSVTLSAVPPKDILAISERWKVAHLGCFFSKNFSPLSAPSPKTFENSVTACISKCSTSGRAYASLSYGGYCTCGININRKILMIPVTKNQCNSECPGDKTRGCGGTGSADVYRIAGHSLDTLSSKSIQERSAGCYAKPTQFDDLFSTRKLNPNYNVAECLLYCENSKFVIAGWDSSRICQCGRFDSKFPLSRMGNPVDEFFCDHKICEERFGNCSKKYVRISRTNTEDERCDRKTFLPPSTGRLVALTSFPGSGNTWVRYLIESATGFYSGSVFSDNDLYTKGFLGEMLAWNSRRTSVIKSHGFSIVGADLFEAAIFIVRSPYDAIMAEFNRVRGGHVGFAEPGLFKTEEWFYFVSYKVFKWFNVIEDTKSLKDILLIYFEDIVADPIKEVRKMVHFLNYSVENLEERLACLETNLSGNFKRPKRTLPFDPYTQTLKNAINKYINEAREMFASENLPPLPGYEK